MGELGYKFINETLLEKLEKIVKENNIKIDNLNDGGCAKFANFLIEELKNIGVEYNILGALYKDSINLKTKIKLFFGYKFIPHHIFVEINNEFVMDGYEINNKKDFYKKYKNMNIQIFTDNEFYVWFNQNNWNPKYDVTQDLKVEEIIKNNFK